ncbi:MULTISPECIES: DUF6916 family protein [unclassified Paraburkholderia]|uniref:DUF6916 family protein n=1 Tax=unclassified Paraburkholderia TaxID=2615204 RepID=UPI002AB30840|nr:MULTISPECIES: hypothetical protein [unclassified Paraburkholderia]
MSDIPTHAELRAALGHIFTLASADEAALALVQTRLIAAPEGVPMNDGYECYSAHFELPPQIQLAQDTYRFIADNGHMWMLFATPIMPMKSGAGVLCAIVHREKPTSNSQPANEAAHNADAAC